MIFCARTALSSSGIRSGGGPLLLPATALVRGSVRAMGHGSHASDNNPEILAKEKQRNLEGKTPEVVPGEPGWNPALASESEAVIRADRVPSMPMEELQRVSIEAMGKLDAAYPDKTSPGGAGGSVDGAYDPSGPAIRDNLAYDKTRPGEHPQ